MKEQNLVKPLSKRLDLESVFVLGGSSGGAPGENGSAQKDENCTFPSAE